MSETSNFLERTHAFGASLRGLRKGRGVSLERLAALTGLSERTIRVLEAGGGSIASVEAVVRALDLALKGLPRNGDGRSLGPRLAAARQAEMLTISALASRAGMNSRTLEKVEAGRGHMASAWRALDALGRKLEVRSGEIMRRTTPADRDDRFTPPAFLAALTEVFGPVGLDPCGNRLSPIRAERIFYQEDDGLARSWDAGGLVFVNPPWSASIAWVRKAVEEHENGGAGLVVLLLKAVTAGSSFQLQHQHGDILLLKKRVAFLGSDGERMGSGTVSAWPSLLTVLGGSAEQMTALRTFFPGTLIQRSVA